MFNYPCLGDNFFVGLGAMASAMDAGFSGEDSAPRTQNQRKFRKDQTIVIDVSDNSRIKTENVFQKIVEMCGVGSVLACVPRSGNQYEVTLDGRASMPLLLEGIDIEGSTFECHPLVQDAKLVSFLHLPAYVDDREIEEKKY